MTKRKSGQVNAALEKALEAELEEVRRKHAEDVMDGEKKVATKGENVYSLIDRMRVYDRFLKLEQLKLKVDDPEWGSKFGDKE